MRLRKHIVAGAAALLAIGGIWWAQTGSTGEDSGADGDGTGSTGESSRRSSVRATVPTECRHQLLSVEVGDAWRYEFTAEDRSQELRFEVEGIRHAPSGYEVAWLATVIEGDTTHEDRFTTACTPGEPIELPLNAFTRAFATDWDPPKCLFDEDLQEGTEVRDHASTEIGDLERLCRIGRTEQVSVPAGSFDAVAVDVTERRSSPGEEDRVSRSTEWIARDVGVVRAEYATGAVALVQAP